MPIPSLEMFRVARKGLRVSGDQDSAAPVQEACDGRAELPAGTCLLFILPRLSKREAVSFVIQGNVICRKIKVADRRITHCSAGQTLSHSPRRRTLGGAS